MKVVKLNCTACGAPISVPEDLDRLNCSACGSLLQVDRGEGYITLRILEKISQAIEASGKETTDAIKESSYVTKTELQKLQIQQEIIANQTILANIESEIRSLKRTGMDKVNLTELDSLYAKQYQILDKLRILEQKYLSPKPDDLENLISAAQKELAYIDQELSVLYLSNIPGKSDAIKTLQKIRSERSDYITNLKANEIRKKFPILLQKSLSVDDTQQALSYLNLLSEIETSIQSLPDSPEKNLLLDEIKKRKDKLSRDWADLEKGRVSVLLHFISPIPDNEDLDSMNAKLRFMDENLQVLQNQNPNWVVQDLLKEQQLRRDNLQRNVTKVEKQLKKEQVKLAKSLANDERIIKKDNRIFLGLGAFIASLGVFLGGLWLAVKNAIPKPSDRKVSFSSDIIYPDTSQRNDASMVNEPALVDTHAGPNRLKSIAFSFLLFIIIVISFSCLGLIVYIILPENQSLETSQNNLGISFVFFTIGLFIAGLMFSKKTFGSVRIKGLFRLPDIRLSSNHPEHGIQQSLIVKILVGLFVAILFFSIMFTIYSLIPYDSEGKVQDSAGTLAVLGTLLSPIFGIVTALRTKVEKPQKI